MNQSNVEVSFEQNALTIRGEKDSLLDPSTNGELRMYAAERVAGLFERSIGCAYRHDPESGRSPAAKDRDQSDAARA